MAACSDGEKKKNVNKTKEVKRLERKLRREQKKASRNLEANTTSYTTCKKRVHGKEYICRKPIYKILEGYEKYSKTLKFVIYING